MKVILAIVISLPCILGAYEGLDPREILCDEISSEIRKISGAVMGIAELVVEMKADVKTICNNVENLNKNNLGRIGSYSEGDKSKKYEFLAGRIEKILAAQNTTEVQLIKEDIRRTVEINFIRALSTMLVPGRMKNQERQENILKLMKLALNGRVDFSPVVDKLPVILRDSQTNPFINLLKTLKENGDLGTVRQDEDEDEDGQVEETESQGTVQQPAVQQGTVQQAAVQQGTVQQGSVQPAMKQNGLNQLIDALVPQLNNFVDQIPNIVQGIETVVDGAGDTFG